MLKFKYIFLFVIGIVLCIVNYSCKRKCFELETVESYQSPRPPLMKVIGKDSQKCVYFVDLYIMLKNKTINTIGELYLSRNAFYVNIDSLSIVNLKFFDFSKEVGESYSISFDIYGEKYKIEVHIDNIVDWKNDVEVYIFCFKEIYYYMGKPLDVIMLCSKENGILGTYLTTYEDGKKFLIAPGGEILRDYIDYKSYTRKYLR